MAGFGIGVAEQLDSNNIKYLYA